MKKQAGLYTDKKKPAKSGIAPKEKTEKDIDDLVHSKEEQDPVEMGEHDPDDLVHQPNKNRLNQAGKDKYDTMEDPDDLVHGYPEDDDD